jgi:hypothetical protein
MKTSYNREKSKIQQHKIEVSLYFQPKEYHYIWFNMTLQKQMEIVYFCCMGIHITGHAQLKNI